MYAIAQENPSDMRSQHLAENEAVLLLVPQCEYKSSWRVSFLEMIPHWYHLSICEKSLEPNFFSFFSFPGHTSECLSEEGQDLGN